MPVPPLNGVVPKGISDGYRSLHLLPIVQVFLEAPV